MKKIEYNKPFIIAEIGSNHNQDIKIAYKLIKIAKNCGADAVKFQLFDSKKLYPNNLKMRKIFKKIELKKNWVSKLQAFSKANNIEIFFSVFDIDNLNFLEKFKFDYYKIASSEMTNFKLLNKIAKTNKFAIISTGMCDLDDVSKVVKLFKKKIVLMQCHSVYPLPIEQSNLNVLNSYKKNFKNIILGFSDHTRSDIPALVSVGLGCKVFEKHITLNNNSRGPDHFYAYTPKKFRRYVKSIHTAFKSLGSHKKEMNRDEKLYGRRYGLYLKNMQKKNTILKKNMIKINQPAIGIRDKYINKVIGKRLKFDLAAGKPILISNIK